MKLLIKILLMLFLCLLTHCGDAKFDDLEKIEVIFENKSQFSIEALYVHDQVDNYSDKENRIDAHLSPNESRKFLIPKTRWYVTVFRKKNRDASVLAYTTGKAWDPAKHPKLIYFDEQFRAMKKDENLSSG